MPPFKIVSEFQPMGDQPQAIEKLTQGLNEGLRQQTLLGATGTGKSLGYHDPVFIVEKRGEQLTPRVTEVGPLIDEAMRRAGSRVRQEGESDLLDLDEADVEFLAQSLDPLTCEVGLYPILSFTRHAPSETMYRLQTACGRNATLTGDHNLWVLRDGQLTLIETAEARPTDHLPLPLTLLAEGEQKSIDTVAALSGKRLFVHAREAILGYLDAHGTQTLSTVLEEQGLQGSGKIHSYRHDLRGQGIEASVFQKVLERTKNLGNLWEGSTATIGGKLSHNRLPATLELTPLVLRLFGYYIAEGNHQRGYVILANQSETIRNDIEAALESLGLPFSVRASSDYQISSTALAELLGEQCGHDARSKQLPDFWPQLSNEQLGTLLRAYFDGDGTVERASAVTATTASEQLASDLLYALFRFGIWARSSRRWKKATNSEHAGDWYYIVTISGQDDLARFQQQIGFSLPYKQEALARLLNRDGNSNVDLVPIDGTQLRWLRQQLARFAREIAATSGLSRSAIQMIETGQRAPQRKSLKTILHALREAGLVAHAPREWWEVWATLNGLCNLRWTPIASVEAVEYEHPYVYDFTVPGAETFLAGSGGFFVHNTYTVAQVIERVQTPTLVLAHNKTLAAQLYSEFKSFFPENAVEYFVSYYDYYQPEAYVPQHDLFIEKDSAINDEINRLRLAATQALFSRDDVIIVASVSAIYGLGSPEDYGRVVVELRRGEVRKRDRMLRHLIDIHYERNDYDLKRGAFRVRGDTVEIIPAYEEAVYRIEFWGDEIERITEVDGITGEILREHVALDIYPAKHFITPQDKLLDAIRAIEEELRERLTQLRSLDKLLEAQRLEQRTKYDLEMLQEIGYCSGVENYSRHLAQRLPGSTPWTLLDYFPDNFLMVIDESHMTLPQVRGMFNGDRARKETLVEYGFRLPSALDNRPLTFDEFSKHIHQTIYVSATPGPYEREHSEQIVDQIIRPTGVVDPAIHIRPTKGQVDDLVSEINQRIKRGERTLVTTLTKRMSEDLADYLANVGIKVHYLHSEIQTLERVEILRELRLGVYDVVVGINLLREGLDLPEVSLVAILDADKEGFLRSDQALIQTIGRAARHVDGTVIMYADRITDSMQRAIGETDRRRAIQVAYNEEHGIEPRSIAKAVKDLTDRVRVAEAQEGYNAENLASVPKKELERMIEDLTKQMKAASQELEFERAALLRDQINDLRVILDADDQRPEWEKIREQQAHEARERRKVKYEA